MPETLISAARIDPSLIAEARHASGLTGAPLSRVLRAGLLALAGHPNPVAASEVPMGRRPKNPPK